MPTQFKFSSTTELKTPSIETFQEITWRMNNIHSLDRAIAFSNKHKYLTWVMSPLDNSPEGRMLNIAVTSADALAWMETSRAASIKRMEELGFVVDNEAEPSLDATGGTR